MTYPFARVYAAAVGVALFASTTFAQALLQRIPLKQHLFESQTRSHFTKFTDINGDGQIDVLVGNSFEAMTVWSGVEGTFGPVASFPATASNVRAAKTADLDGDGDLDVLTDNTGDLGYYRNDGTNVFVDVTNGLFGGPLASPDVFLLGDIDSDGDVDAVFGDPMRIYRNNGIGLFTDQTAALLPTLNAFNVGIQLGDFDADGDLDLVVVRGGIGQSLLLINDGNGAFSISSQLLPSNFSSGSPVTVLAEDIDGDGDLDVIAGYATGTQQTTIWHNDGTGQFVDATAASISPSHSDAELEIGDLDGDGDLDMITGPVQRVLLNSGGGQFVDATAGRLPTDLESLDAELGDADADGDLDLLLSFDDRSRPHDLFLNDGTGRFFSTMRDRTPPLPFAPVSVVSSDVDADGRPDAYFGAMSVNSGTALHVMTSQEDGPFVDETDWRLGVGLTTQVGGAIATADMTGNGYEDIIQGGLGGPIRLFRNQSGLFSDILALPSTNVSATSIATGDVDGDGALEILIGSAVAPAPGGVVQPGQNRLYQRFFPGTTIFSDDTAAALPAVVDSTLSVALADLDGDQDLDALIGNAGQNSIWINDGTGVFTDNTAAAIPDESHTTWSIATGDVDGDGDIDFVAANLDAVNALYRNDGTGVFTREAIGPTTPQPSVKIELVDMDFDSDLDMVIGNFQEGLAVSVRLNDGSGTFLNGDFEWVALGGSDFATRSFAIADYDVDGDLDVMVASTRGPRLLLGTQTPQIRALTVPRLGMHYTLRVEVPEVLSTSAILLSPAAAQTPIATPFGEFRLDPSSTVFLGSFLLNSIGNVLIPANSSLAGVDLHWQALWGPPAGGTPVFSEMYVDRVYN